MRYGKMNIIQKDLCKIAKSGVASTTTGDPFFFSERKMGTDP